MRFSTFITLAAAPLLALAASQETQQQQDQDTPLITAAPENHSTAPLPTQTVAPEASDVVLELRQDPNLLATKPATQVPATADYWIADHWDAAESTEIWTHVIYTQSFPSGPRDQMTTAGAGEIGLGTHTGEIGVVKAANGGSSVMPQGSLVTALLGAVGVAAGMGFVLL